MDLQKAGRKALANLVRKPERVWVVHYACESFDKDSATGSIKVTAIGVRNLGSSDTRLWSIFKSAEVLGLDKAININLHTLETHLLRSISCF